MTENTEQELSRKTDGDENIKITSAVRIVFFHFELNNHRRSKVTSSKYLLNKFNCFYGIFVLSEPNCVKWLHIRLRLESLDDTDDSMFVDFVGY